MNDKDAEILAAEYEIGEQAEAFMASDIGRYVQGCSDQEIEELRRDLETEGELIKIQAIQRSIAARRLAIEWLKEAIDKGHNAGAQLELTYAED